jgi:hypothetical protein
LAILDYRLKQGITPSRVCKYHPITQEYSIMSPGSQRLRYGRVWVWPLIALLFGFAIGAGTVLILKREKGSIPGSSHLIQADELAFVSADELALVPTDALGFVHIRVRDLWKSEFLAEFRKIVEKAGPEKLAMLDDNCVPKPSSLDRVTFVLMGSAKVPQGETPLEIPDDPPKPVTGRIVPKQQPKRALIDGLETIDTVGIFTFTIPYDTAKVRATLLPRAIARQVAGKEIWDDSVFGFAAYFPSDSVLVYGTSVGVTQLLTKQLPNGNKPEGPLTDALDLAIKSGRHCVAALNTRDFHINLNYLNDDYRILLLLNPEEMIQLAKHAKPLSHAEAFAIGAAIGSENSKVDVHVYFKGDSEANQGELAVRALAEFARKKLAEPRRDFEKMLKVPAGYENQLPILAFPEMIAGLVGHGAVNHIEEYLSKPPLKREGKELIATFELPSIGEIAGTYTGIMATAILPPALAHLQEEVQRISSTNNLDNIGIALSNYHNSHNSFPVSSPLKKTDPVQLSWRVQLLPFLGEEALYREFKLDEQWDGPNNKKLIDRMPKVYRCPLATAPPGQTYYKVFSGGGAVFEPGRQMRVSDIRDGLYNTILAVEGGDPVIWTKPDDIPFDPVKPLPNLSLQRNRRIRVLMAYGPIRIIDLDRVSEKTLKAAITRNGNEILGEDWGP